MPDGACRDPRWPSVRDRVTPCRGGGGPGGQGSFSVRLVDVPASLANDTRVRQYVIDNLRPGTTIRRRVEVANTSDGPAGVVMYPSSARIKHGSFIGTFGRRRNELTSWMSLGKKWLRVPAHSTARTSVTIHVPRDAAPGERYGSCFLSDGYLSLALIKHQLDGETPVGMNHFGFHIEDTAATSEALTAAGTPKPAERFTDRPFAEYRAMDPEGNWFDLSEHGFGGPRPPSSDPAGS
ncbi:VOC family protein [Streptomyces sp. NPDC004393]